MNANTLDISNIMCEQEISVLSKLCIFVNIVMKHFRIPPC